LDALQLEDEEESTSYLADLNGVPDFVDEPPVEVALDVSMSVHNLSIGVDTGVCRLPRKRSIHQPDPTFNIAIFVLYLLMILYQDVLQTPHQCITY
jgi:hypothetical protein